MRASRRYRLPLLLIVLALGVAAWLRWPRRLDVPLDGSPAIQHARAGAYTVTIACTLSSGTDNGVAALQVASAVSAITVDAAFNYDTLMSQPAGIWHYAWVDADAWPDVLISANALTPRTITAGSADGQVREVAAP